MRLARPLAALFIAFALAGGCTADNGTYEADWEGESPFAGGKADGLLDIVPSVSKYPTFDPQATTVPSDLSAKL